MTYCERLQIKKIIDPNVVAAPQASVSHGERVVRGWLVILLVIAGWWTGGNGPCMAGSSWRTYTAADGLPGNDVVAFAAGRTLMVAVTTSGVAVFSPFEGQWQPLLLPPEAAEAVFQDVALDAADRIWAATNKGVLFFPEQGVYLMGTRQGLPNLDVQRILIDGNRITVGCFGGFLAEAVIPDAGQAMFFPVNFSRANEDDPDGRRLRSVGISALGRDGQNYLAGTHGAGLLRLTRLDSKPFTGLPSDWVEGFWRFRPRKDLAERMLVLTATGIGLTENDVSASTWVQSSTMREAASSSQNAHPADTTGDTSAATITWFTAVVTFREEPDPDVSLPPAADGDQMLAEFLGERSLWLGTRDDGLWQYHRHRWKQYLPETTPGLGDRRVRRLYGVGRQLVVCTPAGLTFVSLDGLEFDEMKFFGIGQSRYKTFYPAGCYAPVTAIVKGPGLWVATTHGMARYAKAQQMLQRMPGETEGFCATREPAHPESSTFGVTPDAPSSDDGDKPIRRGDGFDRSDQVAADNREGQAAQGLTIFSKELGNFPSDHVTALHCDENRAIWAILERKILLRARVRPQAGNPHGHIVWDFPGDQEFFPWQTTAELQCVWSHRRQLYIGTRTEGFFRCKNPELVGSSAARLLEWEKFGTYEHLDDVDVIGFAARYRPGREPVVHLLHPRGVTAWDGTFFRTIDLGGSRTYEGMAADPEGRLWLASDRGLRLLQSDNSIVDFTQREAPFASNRIRAVAISPRVTTTGISLWVATDETDTGCDQFPWVVTTSRGLEIREQGPRDDQPASLHYFDGQLWDTWKIGGIRHLMSDGDFLWIGTDIRLLRHYRP